MRWTRDFTRVILTSEYCPGKISGMDTNTNTNETTAVERRIVAFADHRRVAQGSPAEVALVLKAETERDPDAVFLVFDAETSRAVELDLRGTTEEVLARLEPRRRSAGRPKLGVVAREVTLLPRHWEWLQEQPGGASVALRKLVDQARHAGAEADRTRRSRDAAYRFMVVMAGDRRGFEEASRALFAGDAEKLRQETEAWPADIRDHLLALESAGH